MTSTLVKHRRARPARVTLVLALGLTACAGVDSDPAGPDAPPTAFVSSMTTAEYGAACAAYVATIPVAGWSAFTHNLCTSLSMITGTCDAAGVAACEAEPLAPECPTYAEFTPAGCEVDLATLRGCWDALFARQVDIAARITCDTALDELSSTPLPDACRAVDARCPSALDRDLQYLW